ncbi:c-type cytochrome biogenesis protein CcsB [Timonella senegalensis]|uniref:c-type cytochrome biogenesis protein CcsB n=1 Tax=Timonella senegalensis TaxID=1465825 RepID=UPI0002E55EE5|nr:c-type cytochrome biogenesis protein CcsB [Timonella senegalensis]
MGQISDYLVWGAATAYAIALVCFAIDLGRVSEAIGARKAARTKALAQAEGSGAVSGGAIATALGGESASADEPISYVGRSSKALGIAMAVTTVGFLLHAGAVVTRGFAAGRVPWANMYEFCLVGTFVAVGAFLAIQIFKEIRYLGGFITFVVLLFLVVGMNVFHIQADSVQPALQRYWLVIHVGIAVIATGIFTVAFVVSLLQLLRDSRDNGSPLVTWNWLEVLPNADRLEALSFRINAVGFVLWTFTLISGAIWAEDAWGRAWGWDPKEVWSFIVWVVYAAYLHARTTRGWSGRRAAYFVMIGYATVLFNFTGVNILFSGKHSYGGLN